MADGTHDGLTEIHCIMADGTHDGLWSYSEPFEMYGRSRRVRCTMVCKITEDSRRHVVVYCA